MTTPILIGDNNEQINEILKDQRLADKKVCVVSVAGAFRTGKSFILNFFLRYLRAQANGTEEWMDMEKELTGNKDKPDTGFHWCRSAKSVTKGILIWPELFLLKDRNGEEVVVILMDTEGIFDTGNTDKKNVTKFALSTMISSVQVFNIQNKIQVNHLRHLQLFANYAQMALEEEGNSTKPFQSLLFLVRDWSDAEEYEYGINGGQRILDEILEVNPDQSVELQELRRHVDSAFNDIRCFLMPHPGLQVANSAQFRGELDNIDSEFKAQLRSLVTHLFHPDNLVVKQINGQPISCRELADYINAYSEVFRDDKLPEPMTIFTATAEVTNSAAVDNAKAIYEQKMEKGKTERNMGDMPSSNGKSLPSDASDDNVSELGLLAKQQQLTNQVRRRRFFCDDVLLNILSFLQRKEHAQARLASQRLLKLSDISCTRYPPRVVPPLEVNGIETVNNVLNANSICINPQTVDSHLVDFPTVEPPEGIVHLSQLDIYDFVGPELLQFLTLSTRLLCNCRIIFEDFDNFVRHHSTDFIVRFFGLFPIAKHIGLSRVSSLAAPLFRDHPIMFDCSKLVVNCLDTFPLDALQGWLHLNQQQPPKQQMERHLDVKFEENCSVASVRHFVQQLRQRFLNANSCCPFTVEIKPIEFGAFNELEAFSEHNERTGELLELNWLLVQPFPGFYQMKRSRQESAAGQGSSDGGEAETEGSTTTQVDKETMVVIWEVEQGDRQPDAENLEE